MKNIIKLLTEKPHNLISLTGKGLKGKRIDFCIRTKPMEQVSKILLYHFYVLKSKSFYKAISEVKIYSKTNHFFNKSRYIKLYLELLIKSYTMFTSNKIPFIPAFLWPFADFSYEKKKLAPMKTLFQRIQEEAKKLLHPYSLTLLPS